MVTKKQTEKNADFKKVKLKVGKKLKKTQTTDSSIVAKKLVLSTQLDEKTETEQTPLSYRGLSLDELCKQLGHFSKSVRRDALMGTKQLLCSRPDLISSHLRNLIPSIARLLSDPASDQQMKGHLKALLSVLCSVSEQAMSPHFTLLVAHVLRALTHMELSTRNLALSILSLLMSSYPRLCRSDSDIFPALVRFLASSCKPRWNAPKFLERISMFLSVFDTTASLDIACLEGSLNFAENKVPSFDVVLKLHPGTSFDFAIHTSDGMGAASPFELPESLLSLSKVLEPVITTSVLEDKSGAFLADTVNILQTMGRAAENQPNSFLVPDFREKLQKMWSKTLKAIDGRKTEKLRNAVQWLR